VDVTIYTTAPKDYDWAWARELSPCVATDKRGKAIRKVVLPEERAAAQIDRYYSGLHMVVERPEFDKLVNYGLVTLATEAP
jgi:hypothetical protein